MCNVPDRTSIKPLWKKLLNDVAPALVPGTRYCAVPSMEGSKYKPGGIAVIGRAPNGWAFDFSKDDIEDRLDNLVDRIVGVHVCTADPKVIGGRTECRPMHWLKHPYTYRGATRVNARFGRFWPMVAEVTQDISGLKYEDALEETIAWTNLYPVSQTQGNPSQRLATKQRAASANLLVSALRAWKPRAALFITEVNSPRRRSLEWSEPFHEQLEVADIKRRNEGAVVATSTLLGGDIRAIFAVRPDARHGVRHDFRDDIRKALRDCRCAFC